MKKLPIEYTGQFRLLKDIAGNRRFPYRATIAAETNFIVDAYKDYLRCHGNPWTVKGRISGKTFNDAMSSLYRSKITQVKYIGEMRKSASGRCCSMCGSLSSTQVDHFLPQHFYPEFSVFKPNLVPICGCNQIKLNKTIGLNFGERFLHPRYDRKTSERSIFVRIRDHGGTPTYQVTFKKPKRMRNGAAFEFHMRTLVAKNGIETHVKDGFERFCRRPSSVATVLKRKNPESKPELIKILSDELEEATREHGTKNNWESIFLHALLERRTINWIWRSISTPGRALNDPLVAL